MGRVWRATDVVLHRDVAIKELVPPPGLTPDERREMRERSLREARAIARLNNINVVRVFDVLRTDADPWIVMEYVPSRSLQDMLASDGPFPPVRAAEIGLGVLNALRAAHRNGVVHRDVKPGNVLIGPDGRVVLTDFGLATVPGDPNVTRTGLVLGSPAYIAPERARDGTAGPAADLWSLGATLYAAVEGASPFARPTAIATLAALATENPPQARNAGPLKPVLNGLLRKDPTHRINAEEAERLLLRATGRRARLAFPMSPTMRRPGGGRERPARPSTPPVIPGSPIASGSAPVVPGPRPPVSTGHPGVRQDDGARPPVFTPGKATVGGPARPAAEALARADGPKVEPPRLDATRLDAPPVPERELVIDEGKSITGTGTGSQQSTGQRSEGDSSAAASASAYGALARDLRGAVIDSPEAPSVTEAEAPGTTEEDRAATDAPGPSDVRERAEVKAEPSTPTAADAGTSISPASGSGMPASVEAAGGPITDSDSDTTSGTDAEPAPETPVSRDVERPTGTGEATNESPKPTKTNKPVVGARAGAAGSKASRKRGRGRLAAAMTAAGAFTKVPADDRPETAEADRPEVEQGEAAEPEIRPAVEATTAPVEAATNDEADGPAEVVELPRQATPKTAVIVMPEDTPKTAAARSAERKVTTAAVTAPTTSGPDSAAGTAVIDIPATRTSATPTGAGTMGDPSAAPATGEVPGRTGGAGFTTPTRPPWQPMSVPRRDELKPGLTVLGTTLTRRQTAIGVALLLVIVLALILLVPRAFDGGGKDDASVTPTPPSSAAATATTSAPAGPPPAASAEPTTPSKSTPAGTSPRAATLPKGWKTYTDPTGFSVPLPAGIRPRKVGSELYFQWNNRLLIIAQTDQPKPDPLADWQQQERDRSGDQYRNYQRISLKRVDYFQSAADWEFTYTTASGNRQHAVKRNFLTSDTQAYSINWYTSPGDWTAAKKDIQAIYQGFKPRK